MEIKISQQVVEMLQPGKKIKVRFRNHGPTHPDHIIFHIRDIVDEYYIVYKFWSREKKRWIYEIKYIYYFELLFKDGEITESK